MKDILMKKVVFLINKKVIIILSFLFLSCLFINSIKFKVQDKNGNELILQAKFDIGFSAQAIAGGLGITDYESLFIKTAFHFQEFGIGFDFRFRFKLFIGETEFVQRDWYIEDQIPILNKELNTFFLYLDKIDYIKYGDLKSPIYGNIGKNPVYSFSNGFLIKDFHNHAFEPITKELGMFFHFDGKKLDKYELKELPIDFTFIINDMLDPDIFAFDAGVDIFGFTKFKSRFNLRVGYSTAFDLNSLEANRLSSLDIDNITLHRNLSTTNTGIYTSFPWFSNFNVDFVWPHKIFKLIAYNSTGLLVNNNNVGAANKLGLETRFVNLKNSGYLIGVLFDFIIESPNYLIEYFSSNYEVVRQKQYYKLQNNNDATFYLSTGIGIYAFQERIKFQIKITIPLIEQFTAKLSAKFIMENTVVPGLYFSVFYETGMNAMYGYGNGGGFIDSITRDFRFAFEGGYSFFGAKLKIVVGIQRPAWIVPGIIANDYQTLNPFEILNNGNTVPNSFSNDSSWENYNWDMNLDTYNTDLEKFVSLEISFAF